MYCIVVVVRFKGLYCPNSRAKAQSLRVWTKIVFLHLQKTKTVPKGINGKTGKLIPVQQTAPPRRTRPHVGRTPGTMGRRRKGATKRKIINDDESVWYALPNPKKKKIAQSHSLKEAVEKNISGTKKH